MGIGSIVGFELLVIVAMMLCIWVASIVKNDASIVDLFWGAGFFVVAISTIARVEAAGLRTWLLLGVTGIWGTRLSLYLAWRNHGQPEDYRYREMREKHGERFPLVSLVTVFLLQGAVMWVVSLPIQLGMHTPSEAGPEIIIWIGVGVWALGVFFEAVGDWQLARFRANAENRGQLLSTGLWKYTRHPNYFGDFCVWWGIYMIAVGDGRYWWTAIGPAIMSVFLMKFSGVGMLEKALSESKPGFADYASSTNAFFPGPPKKTR